MKHDVPSSTEPTFEDRDVAALAELASVDRRSVVRKLAGLPVKGLAGRRIERAIAEYRTNRFQSQPPPRAA